MRPLKYKAYIKEYDKVVSVWVINTKIKDLYKWKLNF